MVCDESRYEKVGEWYSGVHCNVMLVDAYDTWTGRLKIDDGFGLVKEFGIVEGLTYEFLNAGVPFTIEIIDILYGSDPNYYAIKFKTCDLEIVEEPPEEAEPPDDLLGLIGYIKDTLITTKNLIFLISPKTETILTTIIDVNRKLTEWIDALPAELSALNEMILSGLSELRQKNIDLTNWLEIQLTKDHTDLLSAIDKIEIPDLDTKIDYLIEILSGSDETFKTQLIEGVWAELEKDFFEEET